MCMQNNFSESFNQKKTTFIFYHSYIFAFTLILRVRKRIICTAAANKRLIYVDKFKCIIFISSYPYLPNLLLFFEIQLFICHKMAMDREAETRRQSIKNIVDIANDTVVSRMSA